MEHLYFFYIEVLHKETFLKEQTINLKNQRIQDVLARGKQYRGQIRTKNIQSYTYNIKFKTCWAKLTVRHSDSSDAQRHRQEIRTRLVYLVRNKFRKSG